MRRVVGFLSVFLAFLSIVAAVCLLLMVVGWPVSAQRMQELASELHRMPAVLIIVVAALMLWGIGIIVLYGKIKERLHRTSAAQLEKNEMGESSVSFSALEQIVQRAVKAGTTFLPARRRCTRSAKASKSTSARSSRRLLPWWNRLVRCRS